ncbi:MAG: amidohydrolase family protein [Verrucomicrobiaceae bacterium]|nr:amidohydrolase family protein [Verrucomicrobiaceae bacterium]
MNRRSFLQSTAAASASLLPGCASLSSGAPDSLVIDTHQHLWDRTHLNLPWLSGAPEVLRHDFKDADYVKANSSVNVKAIYMEVDVDPTDHIKEADWIAAKCAEGTSPTIAATIGGRPDSEKFEDYITRYAGNKHVKGLRQVLHGAGTPKGHCLSNNFIRGVQALGRHGMNFEITMRPTELKDGAELIRRCPDTNFVLDHCGNGDPKAFWPKLAPNEKRGCTADGWKRGIDAIAAIPRVMCKISGIVAFVPPGKWQPEHLAPVVNHCLEAFGPERVFYGGDWPVCLLGGPLSAWFGALKQIVSSRPEREQRALWSGNARRFYDLHA